MTKFHLSPSWNIYRENDKVMFSGGADTIFEFDDISSALFDLLNSRKPFEKLRAKNEKSFEMILTMGIITPKTTRRKLMKVFVTGDGGLRFIDNDKIVFVSNPSAADLILVIRANTSYAELLNKIEYEKFTMPHLLVDLAFHHTVSFGPLVFPGETACLACLRGRISRFWGDSKPPRKPAAIENADLIREMIYAELRKILNDNTGLINRTVSFDLFNYQINDNLLLKVPTCKVCDNLVE